MSTLGEPEVPAEPGTVTEAGAEASDPIAPIAWGSDVPKVEPILTLVKTTLVAVVPPILVKVSCTEISLMPLRCSALVVMIFTREPGIGSTLIAAVALAEAYVTRSVGVNTTESVWPLPTWRTVPGPGV